ncbi:MAG: CGNR zinc finger domain-containing protein [Pseudonocardiaceae bacterium]
MQFNPYGGGGAGLAAALVNMPPSATPRELAAAMRLHDNPRKPPTLAQTQALQRWSRQLSPVFGSIAVETKVALANELLARSASQPHISQHDGKPPHLHFAPDDCDTIAAVQAFTAAGLAVVVCSDPDRLGRCAADGCEIVFVDTSRNGRRRFCCTACATRIYVAVHRARSRSGT